MPSEAKKQNMKCPVCGCRDSKVLDSRPVDDETSIKRRRECPACGRRFTTYEVIDNVPVTVVKRTGEREFFDLHKLTRGIERACQRRPVDPAEVAAGIEAELQNGLVTEITSREIGDMVLNRLQTLDPVSCIRFASVYREFQDIDSFTNEIRRISRQSKKTKEKNSQ